MAQRGRAGFESSCDSEIVATRRRARRPAASAAAAPGYRESHSEQTQERCSIDPSPTPLTPPTDQARQN
jgi:hypothetical protein